jgi:hypothetical protein
MLPIRALNAIQHRIEQLLLDRQIWEARLRYFQTQTAIDKIGVGGQIETRSWPKVDLIGRQGNPPSMEVNRPMVGNAKGSPISTGEISVSGECRRRFRTKRAQTPVFRRFL